MQETGGAVKDKKNRCGAGTPARRAGTPAGALGVNQRRSVLVYTLRMGAGLLEEKRGVADFDAVMQAYRPRIFRFALASLRDRDAAETVTQDCFLKAYRAWDQFRGDASMQTWLMQIAVNLVRDVARSRRFQFWKRASASSVDLDAASAWIPDRGASPEAQAAARQRVAAIWEVVAGLSPNQRTVFLLHFLEGMAPAEIEASTGITRAAIKVHLFRAVHAVREKLGRVK